MCFDQTTNISVYIQRVYSAETISQVYDSPVDLEGIPIGVPAALTRSKTLRFLGKMGLHAYLTLAYPYATRHYKNASIHFKQKPVNVPILFFNSLVDKVGEPVRDIQGRIQNFLGDGQFASQKGFSTIPV